MSYPQQQELLDALGDRRLLVVVGPLVREAAGLLGMRGLVDTALQQQEFGEAERADIRAAAGAGRFADAFEAIKFHLGPRFAAVFEPLLAGPKVAPPASLRALAGLAGQLSQILTTNLDSLVETTLSGAWVALAGATADLASRTRTIFKLLGTAHVVSTWKFTADGLQNATHRQAHVRQEVAALLRSHRLLLIGFRGDDELLELLVRMREHAPEDRNAPAWVAMVPPGTPGMTRQALGRRGVELVTLAVRDVAAYDEAVADHLRSLVRVVPPVVPETAASEPMLSGNPYPGLAPFVEAQAGQFFGRADARADLLGKLGRRGTAHVRWLSLTGPSGVGKSSLLAAGLVPALRGGVPLPGAPTRWAVALLRPGREVLRNLAEAVRDALARDLGVATAPELLTRDTLLQERSLADFLASRLQGAGLLVVLDQFEEAFTVGAAEDRPHLDALLVRSLQDVEVPFYLLTAMRSDCASELGRDFPRLAEQQNLGTLSARHDLAPLRPHELREAIERPAELAGRALEPRLVERILHDAGAHAGPGDAAPDAALPLVAHVLHALHEQAAGRALTLRAYEALGGVAESLTRSADALLAALVEEFPTQQVRNLLVALVELHPQGRDTRRVLPWAAALASAGGDEADASTRARSEALLRRLSGGTARPGDAQAVRLLATRGEGEHAVVDLVHDALLREWSTLHGWLQEDRAAGLLRQELERAADGWAASGQPNDELWRGNRLARATALDQHRLPQVARSFLAAAAKLATDEAAARAAEQAEKLRAAEALAMAEHSHAVSARRKNRGLMALGGVFLAAAVVAFSQYRAAANLAVDKEIAARDEQGARASALARIFGRELEALELAVNATGGSVDQISLSSPVIQGLSDGLSHVRRAVVVTGGSDHVWAPDGSRLVIGGLANGDIDVSSATLWDVRTGSAVATLEGHVKSIDVIAWTTDGERVATASWDTTVRLWSGKTGAVLATLEGHTGSIRALAWTKDGALLATASADKTSRIWSGTTGENLRTIYHDDSIRDVSWAHNESRLVTVDDLGSVALWNAETGTRVANLKGSGDLSNVALSSDSDETRLATSNRASTWIWDGRTGEMLSSIGFGGSQLHWSPDQSRLAIVGPRGYYNEETVILWGSGDLGHRFATTQHLIGHAQQVDALAWTNDGMRLATGDTAGQVRVWDAEGGKTLFTAHHQGASISHLTWSPDEIVLVSGGTDGRVRLWDSQNGTALGVLEGHRRDLRSMAWTSDGKHLATTSLGSARLWEEMAGGVLTTLSGHKERVEAIVWTADGKRLATTDGDVALLWNSADGKMLASLDKQIGIKAFAWSPDGTRIVTAGLDKTLRVWDGTSGDALVELVGHKSYIQALAWSPDGSSLVTAGLDDSLRFWDSEKGTCLEVIESRHFGVINALAWNRNGDLLAAASEEHQIILWDGNAHNQLALSKVIGQGRGVAWAPGGETLATIHYGDSTFLWDTSTSSLTRLAELEGNRGVAWASDASRIVTADEEGNAWVWDGHTGVRLATLAGHTGAVISAVWLNEWPRLATVGSDSTVRMWDGTSGKALVTFSLLRGPVDASAWGSDGARLAVASGDKRVRVFSLMPSEWLTMGCAILSDSSGAVAIDSEVHDICASNLRGFSR